MKHRYLIQCIGVLSLALPVLAAAQPTFSYRFVDTYDEVCGIDNDEDGCAEISAYDPDTGRIFTTNGTGNAVRVLDLLPDNKLADIGSLSLALYGAAPNSVDVSGGVLAVAIENADTQANGKVVFFDTTSLEEIDVIEVGPLPEMLAFTPDGNYLLVANEGEPSDDYLIDPEGSVTIINMQTLEAQTADFSAFNESLEDDVRIFGPGASVAQDLEPEYIAIAPDSSAAFVSLQENNALAIVDIANGVILDVVGLGFKDHSLTGNGFDASDLDGGESCLISLNDPGQCINIQNHPTLGMYQPDAIASYQADGAFYIVSANEGDARDYPGFSEEFRVGDEQISLDETVYPDAQVLKEDAMLGRLKTTAATGDTDGDGDLDRIYSYGARSFSIWSTAGELVYDSGDDFEQRLSAFQQNGMDVWTDSRSDDKGPEPESLYLAEINGRTIAFVGLERVSGIFAYDITNPMDVSYLGYINTKLAGDISPEGLVYVPRSDSTGVLIVTNEVSNTTSIYRISYGESAQPVIGPGTITIDSGDYFQVQTSDTYEPVCEGPDLGVCTTGEGVFNVINLSTGERFENLSVEAGEPITEPEPVFEPTVDGSVIRLVLGDYWQVQSVEDFSAICEGFGFDVCEVPPGVYHVINLTTGVRYEFIEVGDPGNDTPEPEPQPEPQPEPDPLPEPEPDPQPETFSLKILHINDHHSHLEPESGSLILNEQEYDVEIGGFPRIVSKMRELEADEPAVLKLHAGDAITGTLLYTLFEGEADAQLMNQVCFDAFTVGNHEFDAGDAGLANFLEFLRTEECQTDVLGANVVPEVGVSPLAPVDQYDSIMPFTVKEVNGEQIGIVGLVIANKTRNSSNPDETTEFLDELATAQEAIDFLQTVGVNKIILLTHYQYRNDLELASALDGVDVIVGGDSHSLLGNGFEAFGLNPEGPYPTEVTNAGGQTVCVVQAWEYAQVVGELDVIFDAEGHVESCAGIPHLLLGSRFEQEDENGDDVPVEGDALSVVLAAIETSDELSVVEPDAESQALLDAYSAQAEILGQETIGTATEDLCLERIPGQGRSQICDVADTASKGSDISNLVALAFKTQSNTSDIALQNAGGVRIDVPAGDISVETAYTLLPFANTLVEIDMTGQQIVDTLEDALAFAIDADGSTGAYPYASGLRWAIDLTQPQGSRFSDVEVKLKDETEWSAIDVERNYKVVTNSFIAGGRDGYFTLGDIADELKVDTFLDYAQSFVDYVKAQETISRLPDDEYSTQSFINADGMKQ